MKQVPRHPTQGIDPEKAVTRGPILVIVPPTRTAAQVARSTAAALLGLGAQTQVLPYSDPDPGRDSLRSLARKMIQRIHLHWTLARNRPSVVFFVKAEGIRPRTLARLRRRGALLVNWWIDDPIHLRQSTQLSPQFDLFLTSGPGCEGAHQKAGGRNPHFLPFACDPLIHRPLTLSAAEHETWGGGIAFSGTLIAPRIDYLLPLVDEGLRIWSDRFVHYIDPNTHGIQRREDLEAHARLLSAWAGPSVWREDLARVYSGSLMGLDPQAPGDKLNMRVFEITGCRSLLLANEPESVALAFEPDREFVGFNSPAELLDKVRHFRRHSAERNRIAEAGYRKCMSHHTYAHRAQTLLSHLHHLGL